MLFAVPASNAGHLLQLNANHHSVNVTMNQIEQLTTWLNSAYSMEQNLIKVLENHVKDANEYGKHHGDGAVRIDQHVSR